MGVDPLTGGAGGVGPRNFVRYRKGQCRGMQNALRVIREVHAAWGERFGRYHAPLVEEYRLDDADYALVTIGSMTGAAKDAVDIARDKGEAVGLIKIKTFRPFPLAGDGGRARQGEAHRRGRPLGELRLELRPGLSGDLGRALSHRQIHSGHQLHRRSGRRRHHGRAFRARHRAHARAANGAATPTSRSG